MQLIGGNGGSLTAEMVRTLAHRFLGTHSRHHDFRHLWLLLAAVD